VDAYRELDHERVLVLVRFGGRGKSSGLEIGQMTTKSAGLIHLQSGRVTRLTLYFDHNLTFADVDLPSDAVSDGP
jgi:hypothetical protein